MKTYLINTITMSKKYSINELASAVQVHPDTLYKARRKGECAPKLARKLGKETGIPWILWLTTEEGYNPWEIVLE